MTNNINVVLYNIRNCSTTNNGNHEEHIFSDALVIRKKDSNFLLTIHGDYWTSVDYTYPYPTDDMPSEECCRECDNMYIINGIEANVLSKTSPNSWIFQTVLNKIRKRKNISNVAVSKDVSEMITSIYEENEKLALSKQVEYYVEWNRKIETEEKLEKEQETQSKKHNDLKVRKFLEKS